jgi:hypothetical protein
MLAIITAGVAASLATGLAAWGRGAAAARQQEPWLVLSELTRELEQVAAPGAERAYLVAGDAQSGNLAADNLLFSSACLRTEGSVWRALRREEDDQPWQPIPLRAQVEYALDLGDTPGLYRRELAPAPAEPLEAEGDWELVCPQVRGLDLEWFDGTEWLAEWDSTARDQDPLPRAARVTFYVEPERGHERLLQATVPLAPRFDANAETAP